VSGRATASAGPTHDVRAGRLGDRLDHDLVEVHVRGPRQCEHHAVGDLVRGDRVEALVHPVGGILVAAEADNGELGLDEPRVDRRDTDRPTEKPRTANFEAIYEAPPG
jgi:hypothetical protein